MTAIPDGFLQGNTNLTGTLKVGSAVQTIGARPFFGTRLTGLNLSQATSLVEIGDSAFFDNGFAGTLVIPDTVASIGPSAFDNTKLTGLDLSKATSLVEIGKQAFYGTELEGTIVISASLRRLAHPPFRNHQAYRPRPLKGDLARGDRGRCFQFLWLALDFRARIWLRGLLLNTKLTRASTCRSRRVV